MVRKKEYCEYKPRPGKKIFTSFRLYFKNLENPQINKNKRQECYGKCQGKKQIKIRDNNNLSDAEENRWDLKPVH